MNSSVEVVFLNIVEQTLLLKSRCRDKIDWYTRYVQSIGELNNLYTFAISNTNTTRAACLCVDNSATSPNASVG